MILPQSQGFRKLIHLLHIILIRLFRYVTTHINISRTLLRKFKSQRNSRPPFSRRHTPRHIHHTILQRAIQHIRCTNLQSRSQRHLSKLLALSIIIGNRKKRLISRSRKNIHLTRFPNTFIPIKYKRHNRLLTTHILTRKRHTLKRRRHRHISISTLIRQTLKCKIQRRHHISHTHIKSTRFACRSNRTNRHLQRVTCHISLSHIPHIVHNLISHLRWLSSNRR